MRRYAIAFSVVTKFAQVAGESSFAERGAGRKHDKALIFELWRV